MKLKTMRQSLIWYGSQQCFHCFLRIITLILVNYYSFFAVNPRLLREHATVHEPLYLLTLCDFESVSWKSVRRLTVCKRLHLLFLACFRGQPPSIKMTSIALSSQRVRVRLFYATFLKNTSFPQWNCWTLVYESLRVSYEVDRALESSETMPCWKGWDMWMLILCHDGYICLGIWIPMLPDGHFLFRS